MSGGKKRARAHRNGMKQVHVRTGVLRKGSGIVPTTTSPPPIKSNRPTNAMSTKRSRVIAGMSDGICSCCRRSSLCIGQNYRAVFSFHTRTCVPSQHCLFRFVFKMRNRDRAGSQLDWGQGQERFPRCVLRESRRLHPSCDLHEQAVCVRLGRVRRKKTHAHS